MPTRNHDLQRSRRRAAAVAAVAAVGLVVVADLLASGLVLLPGVLIGPFIAAAFLPPGQTAWIGAYAVAAAAGLGWANGFAGTSRHFVAMAVVTLTSLGAVWLAAGRTEQEGELKETRPEAAEGRRLALALEAGRMGTWSWDSSTERIDYDDGLATLFGRPPGGLPSTRDGWLELLQADERWDERFAAAIGDDGRFRWQHRAVWPDGSVHWLVSVGEVQGDGAGRLVGAVGVTADADDDHLADAAARQARQRAEHAVEMLARIHDLTDEALSRLPLDELLAALPERLARLLGCDTVRVLLLDDSGRTLQVAASYGFLKDYPVVPIPVGQGFEGRIAAADAPIVVEDLRRLQVLSPALRAEVRGAAGVPLRTDKLIGVIDVGHRTFRQFLPDEIHLLRLAGERVARAIERSRIFELERTARERSDYLGRVQHALTRSIELPALMSEVATAAVPRLGDWCSLLVLDPAVGYRREVAHVDPERALWARRLEERFPFVPDAPLGAPAVIRTGRSELITHFDDELIMAATDDDELRDILRHLQLGSSMTVPLRAASGLVGALSLVRSGGGSPYTPDDLQLAEELAGRIAVAIQNSLLFQERQAIAETLQRSLLPTGLPPVAGADVAVRYRAASGGEVGGDFYDVVAVDDRCWGLLVGDVSGKGVTAAALTGVARHTVRAAARHNLAPSTVLGWVHDAMADQAAQSGGQFCTAVYGLLERQVERPDRFTFRFALGGHPRPIQISRDGVPCLVGRPGTLLGALADPRVHESVVILGPGDQLILYTDGVTDVAGPTYLNDDQLLDLVRVHAGSSAEETAQALEDAVVRRHASAPQRDDIALLVVHIDDPPRATNQ